jgi:hypothetical protein
MGDEGEATLGTSFTERFGSGGAQNQGSPAAAVVQREREREERESKERRKNKKGLAQTGIGTRASASLALYYVTRVPASLLTWCAPRIWLDP